MNYREIDILNAIQSPVSKVLVLNEIDSTNTYIKRNVSKFESGTLVFAKRQTSGRGRRGRSFLSPDGGLYFSILFKFADVNIDPTMITVSAAVAVSDAITELCGIECSIKWVNDILISDKKVCGILAEAVSSTNAGTFDFVVVGIGVNLYTPADGFAPEIKGIAGSIEDFADVPSPDILGALIYDKLNAHLPFTDSKTIIKKYKERSSIIGKDINVLRADEIIPAHALDILDDASLLVEYSDKSKESLFYGDVSVRI